MDAPWIEWAGGTCPLLPDTIVDVRFEAGDVDEGAPACTWIWKRFHGENGPVSGFDIVAYRVVTE